MIRYCRYCGGKIEAAGRLSHPNPRDCRRNLCQLLAESNHALRGALAGPHCQFDWKQEAGDALETGGQIVNAQLKAIDAELAQKRY